MVRENKYCGQDSEECGIKISKVHVIPTSDHSMHMDNADALASTIINDIYNAKIEIFPNPLADKLLNEENYEIISNPNSND